MAATRTRKKTPEPLPTEGVDDALTVIEAPETVIPPVVDDSGILIPDDLIFTTEGEAAPAEISEDDILEFQVDGQDLIAIRPNPEQWGILMQLLAKSATIADRFASMQAFASAVLDDASFLYLQNRLFDRNDPLGTDLYDKILTRLIERFTPEGNRAERRAAARQARR